MALVRVCDRCESDGGDIIKVTFIYVETDNEKILNELASPDFPKSADLCPACFKQFRGFISGELCIEDDSDDETEQGTPSSQRRYQSDHEDEQ
jgi:hypothetical protein